MSMEYSEQISHAYFFAKQYVISKGYGKEIDWHENIDFDTLTKQKFLEEICWVILSSGMNDNVVRKIYPKIKLAMYDFKSPAKILEKKHICFSNAFQVFKHAAKINAILYAAEYLSLNSFEATKLKLKDLGIPFIQTFPYMGKATAFHFAKNIGLDVAKPDRHLLRISHALGFNTPNDLCTQISNQIDEKISLIDLVIWRYSTLDKKYLNKVVLLKENKRS